MERIRKNFASKAGSHSENGFRTSSVGKNFFIRNFFLFIVPTLVPILILGTFTVLVSNNFNREIFEKTNSALLRQMNTNLDLMLNELDAMNLNFDYNIDFSIQMKNLLENPSYSLEEYKIAQLVKNFVSTPANSKSFIHCIYVYFNNNRGRFISSSDGLKTLDDFTDTSWFESFSEKEDNINWWSEVRYISHYEFQPKTPVITIYKKIYSSGMNHANGVVVLNIHLSYVQKMLDDLATFDGQSLIVLNENNQVLFGNRQADYLTAGALSAITQNQNPSFSYRSEYRQYSVFKLKSERYGWEYISVVPDNSFNQISTRLRFLTVSMLALSLILAAVPAYYLAKKNQGNINRIITIIDSAENQRPLPPLPDIVKDEYSYIIHNIMNTFMERSYLKLQLSERKYKQQAAELLTLQSQINPHFLHNTLETIYWEILRISGKPTIANKMIENLSDILKYSLNTRDTFVKLREEIENTNIYIDIQKYRYEDKFDVCWVYPPHVAEYKVKKFILQPLVENSIYHGIKEKEGRCAIKIKIIQSHSHLRIFVTDNGVGILPEALEKIRQKLASSDDLQDHIGLFNTNKRLKLTYGDEYGIRIRSLPNVGTIVCLQIPIITEA